MKFRFSILLFLFSINAMAIPDSLAFIRDLQDFFSRETGKDMAPRYTQWDIVDSPYIYWYVSRSDQVSLPEGCLQPYISDSMAGVYEKTGNHIFRYSTYGNSATRLNRILLSYPAEATAFIVFHELMHNFPGKSIPYEFEEALCDLAGNYLSLKYAQEKHEILFSHAQSQLKQNEDIYERFNFYISRINRRPEKTRLMHSRCDKYLQGMMPACNAFQKQRFDHQVNNAYLLKNQYYSKYYFLLKRVYLKQASMKEFMELVLKMPKTIPECEKYLRDLI